jgi:hypothetical protein
LQGLQPPQGAQALQAAAQGLQAPHAAQQPAKPGDAEPMAAATASGNTVVDIRRLRVDFMAFPLTLHGVNA